MTKDIGQSIKDARRVGVSLIGVTTPDPPATTAAIVTSFNGNAPPLLQWDLVRGLQALNEAGRAQVLDNPAVIPPAEIPGLVPGQSPADALTLAANFPTRTLLVFHNAQRFIGDVTVMQAICNLRDIYKANKRTLVLVGPALTLPAELTQDVLMLDEPLPDEDRIGAIVDATYTEARNATPALPQLVEAVRRECIAALAGLAAFPAEQTFSLAVDMDQARIEIPVVWTRKRATVNQTKGIEMLDDATLPTFADLGGLDEAIRFGCDYFKGRRRPRVVVWLDEIEKMFAGLGSAGSAGDSSGTSQDQLGVMLREQQFNDWPGMILVGPPGAGKSEYARALGRTHGVPTIMLDLGALKGSLVGQSEEQIRAAMKIIKAVAGAGGAFFVATCNDLTVLPPELRRRYTRGIWYFDLPDAAERQAIWSVCLKRFGLGIDAARSFNDEGWTGAEIRNACESAWALDQPIDVAARRVVPVSVSDPQRIEKLRALADGKFLSASYPGTYRRQRATVAAPAARAFQEGD